MRWITSLLGLALPSWVLPVSVVGVLVFSLGGAYLKGRHDANENCKAATLEAQIKILKRDIAIQAAADRQEDIARAKTEQENALLKTKVEAYAEQISPDGNCRLTADDVKRLREFGR